MDPSLDFSMLADSWKFWDRKLLNYNYRSGSHSNSQFNPQLENIPITAIFGNSSTFDQESNRDGQSLASSSPASDKHIKCSECGSKFTARSNLTRHRNEQHRQQKKRYYCSRCHKDFSRKSYQLEHEENVCPLRPPHTWFAMLWSISFHINIFG